MSKKIKELELNALRKTFQGVKDYVVVEPVKLDSATEYEFRKKLREKNCSVKLVKNTLAKKVFSENGIQAEVFTGPTLLVWGADSLKELAVAVRGLIRDLKKDPKAPDKLKVKTAVSEGQPISIEVAETIPTRKEAIGDVVAAIIGPAGALAGCLTGPANNIAGILKAIEDKGGGTEPASAG
jgi:ribosomal protein L10